METHSTDKRINDKQFKLMPCSVRNFRVNIEKTVMCKAKMFRNGIYCNDTVVDKNNNVISICNDTDEIVKLSDLDVKFEDIDNYNVYRIKKNVEELSGDERTAKILSRLDMTHCNEHERDMIKELIHEYNDVFFLKNDGLTFAKNGEHRIFMKPGTNPVNTKQYQIPLSQKSIIQKKIEELLRDDIIEPSTSLWNSPLLLVPKKSSTDQKEYRLVIDYRNVNKQTETQTFSMPNLDEELSKMNGCKYFSTLDVQAAFHQIRLNEADKE